MKVNDAVPGALLIAFAAGTYYLTLDFPPMPGQDYGPSLFPRIIAILLAACGLFLIVKGVQTRHRQAALDVADWMRSPTHVLNVLVVVAVLLFYIFVADWLGFIPTAFIILTVLLLKLRGPGHLGSTLVIAAVTTIVVQQFFGQFLRVPLPWGLLPPLVW